jgi:hypothetical protein
MSNAAEAANGAALRGVGVFGAELYHNANIDALNKI